MALKPPAIQNLARRKKFFADHLDYPNAIGELRKIFAIEMGNLWDQRIKLGGEEYHNRRQALIDEGKASCISYEKMARNQELKAVKI